jgi:MFS family permease
MDPVTSGKNVIDMNEMESKSLVSQKIDHKQNDDPDDPDSSESVSNEDQYCFQGNRNSETTTTKTLLEKNTTELVANTKMNAQLKRNYACICLFALLIGTDFAVIIPTLWDRLSSDFEATGTFMGIVMSSYSLSGVICGLIMGKISDEINKTKSFLLISIFFGIIGHILYFIGISKWLVLLGRVISGLCLGASTVLLAYVAKTTNEKQRTSVISLVMASRQIGLMFAPAFNLFLRKFNFYLFDTILVDRKSAPGMFMAILWSISFVVVVVVYREYFPPQPETTTGGSGPITPAFSLLNKNIYKKGILFYLKWN